MTQWKNLFSFEVFGCDGALVVEGLGGSYGVETLTTCLRKPEGGVPLIERLAYEGEDRSWRLEWLDFVTAVLDDSPMLGEAQDGIVAMRMLDALYRSAASNSVIDL
jgi:predicted dehydrogenase